MILMNFKKPIFDLMMYKFVCRAPCSQTKLQGGLDKVVVDDEHRLIARYVERLANAANNTVGCSIWWTFL